VNFINSRDVIFFEGYIQACPEYYLFQRYRHNMFAWTEHQVLSLLQPGDGTLDRSKLQATSLHSTAHRSKITRSVTGGSGFHLNPAGPVAL